MSIYNSFLKLLACSNWMEIDHLMCEQMETSLIKYLDSHHSQCNFMSNVGPGWRIPCHRISRDGVLIHHCWHQFMPCKMPHLKSSEHPQKCQLSWSLAMFYICIKLRYILLHKMLWQYYLIHIFRTQAMLLWSLEIPVAFCRSLNLTGWAFHAVIALTSTLRAQNTIDWPPSPSMVSQSPLACCVSISLSLQ